MDFACGTGDSTLAISNMVKEIYGIDYSDEMIKFASLKEKHQTNIHFVATTIEDNIFATESFDVIIAFNILHLLEEFDDVMRRIYHLLKPGGLLISSTVCIGEKKNITTFMINSMSKFGMFPRVKSYKCYELEGKISSIGFTIIESVMSSDDIPNMYLVSKKIQRNMCSAIHYTENNN